MLLFFFNDTATTEIYTLSLHDALPICWRRSRPACPGQATRPGAPFRVRSEEHTSELQSRVDLVCRLLLEKKKEGLPILNADATVCGSTRSRWPNPSRKLCADGAGPSAS